MNIKQMKELHKLLITEYAEDQKRFSYGNYDELASVCYISGIGKNAGLHYDPQDGRIAHIYIDKDGKPHIDMLPKTSTLQDLFDFIVTDVKGNI